MQKRLIAVFLLSTIILWNITPLALALDAKYMHFRIITVDGDDSDWSGVETNVFVSHIMRQNGHQVIIDNNTFYPGNVSVGEGDSIVWKNQDENTTPTKLHQIALGVDAPVTWTSDPLDYGDSDYFIAEDVANYTYHTSKVNFLNHAEGNISVYERDWEEFSYSVAFASSPLWLWVAVNIFNISEDGDAGDFYLRGFDFIMDDFADENIEGENAFRVEEYSLGYRAKDMYYDSGYLDSDTNDGEDSNIAMDYSHTIPETEEEVNYLGDLFFEIEIPINTQSSRDIGASAGQSIGIQIVMRVSDEYQDANSSILGVRDFYRGGGYPIEMPYDNEIIDKFDINPEEFIVLDLLGDDLVLVLSTIFEEAWIYILSVIASVFGFLFGGIVIRKKKNKQPSLDCPNGICDV